MTRADTHWRKNLNIVRENVRLSVLCKFLFLRFLRGRKTNPSPQSQKDNKKVAYNLPPTFLSMDVTTVGIHSASDSEYYNKFHRLIPTVRQGSD